MRGSLLVARLLEAVETIIVTVMPAMTIRRVAAPAKTIVVLLMTCSLPEFCLQRIRESSADYERTEEVNQCFLAKKRGTSKLGGIE